jgi:hypothetical protein
VGKEPRWQTWAYLETFFRVRCPAEPPVLRKIFSTPFDATYLSCPRYAVTTPAVLPVVANTLTSKRRVGFCTDKSAPPSASTSHAIPHSAFLRGGGWNIELEKVVEEVGARRVVSRDQEND